MIQTSTLARVGKESASWEMVRMPQPKPDAVPATEETHPLELELNLVKVRVGKAEKQIQVLAEATLALVHGLEARPWRSPGKCIPSRPRGSPMNRCLLSASSEWT